MKCNCTWINVLLSLIIIVFSLFGNGIGWSTSKWVIFVAGIFMFIHALKCSGSCETPVKPKSKKK